MSDQIPTPTPDQAQNPRAAAKAAKAYAKASRPWYRKKRYIIAIVAVIIVIAVVATSGGSGSDGPEKVSSGDAGASAAPAGGDKGDAKAGTKDNPIKTGETVKLEGTQYTVNSAKTAPTVGNEFSEKTAGGIYVVVELTIENTKDETKTFASSAATFEASNGKSYSTDDDGTFAVIAGDADPLIFEDMQPDVPKTGLLVFDVPKDKATGGVLKVGDLFGRGDAYIDLGLN